MKFDNDEVLRYMALAFVTLTWLCLSLLYL